MTCTSSNISNLQEFKNAIHLYPTIEAVAEDNLMKLKQNNQPIAMIKTVHSGHIAAKGTSDDAGGLEPVLPYSRKIWRGIKFGGLAVYNITTTKLKSAKISCSPIYIWRSRTEPPNFNLSIFLQ